MKRGEVSTSQLIIGLVCVFVGVVLIIIAFKLNAGNQTIQNLTPGYNNSKQPNTSGGVLRYNIEKASIESYTGSEWISEEGLFFIGNYQINSGDLTSAFKQYYYFSPRKSYLTEGDYVFDCAPFSPELGMHECYTVFYKDNIPQPTLASSQLEAPSKYPYPFLRGFVSGGPVSDVISRDNSQEKSYGAILMVLKVKDGENYGSIVLLNDNRAFFTPKGKTDQLEVNEESYPGSSVLLKDAGLMRDSILNGGKDETALVFSAKDRRTGQAVSLSIVPRRLQNELVLFLGEAK